MLLRLATLVSIAAVSAGCMTLGGRQGVVASATAAAPANAAVAVATPAGSPPVASAAPTTPDRLGPFPQPDQQQAMRQVLPALQELALADPALHSEVLEQLANSDPSVWSLTVERARNQVAYKRQLAGPAASAASQLAASIPAPPATTPAMTTPLRPTPSGSVVPASANVANPYAATQVSQASVDPNASPSPIAAAVPVVTPTPPPRAASQPATGQALPKVVGETGPRGQWIENTHVDANGAAAGVAPPSVTTVSIRRVPPTEAAQPAARPTEAMSFVTVEPTPTGAGEVSVEPSTPRDWRDALEDAIDGLADATADRPRTTDEANERVRLKLLQLAAGRTDEAVDAPTGLSAAEQGYWSNQLYAISTLLDTERIDDRLRRADTAARYQAEASAKLRGMGDLQVRNFVTCNEVYGFGAYDPHPNGRYRPGDQVVLYAELDNYTSEATAEGHRTSFASSYRLIDDDGDEAAAGDFPLVDDLCLTLRRDFHIQYGVTLPKNLPAGEYRLELAVTDRLGDKIGHGDLRISIAAFASAS